MKKYFFQRSQLKEKDIKYPDFESEWERIKDQDSGTSYGSFSNLYHNDKEWFIRRQKEEYKREVDCSFNENFVTIKDGTEITDKLLIEISDSIPGFIKWIDWK